MAQIDLGKVKVTFGGQWDSSNSYEELTVVKHNGNSYLSKVAVPSGVDISDNGYWEPLTEFTDADLLQRIKNVDGSGSGLDADLLDGVHLDALIRKSEIYDVVSKTFYVDAVNGNDSNDGSQSSPFKTVMKACNSVPSGGVGKIYLYRGQTFEFTSHTTIDNKYITFMQYGDSSGNPKILHKKYTYLSGDGNTYYTAYEFFLNNSVLEYVAVDVEVEARSDTNIPKSSGYNAIKPRTNSAVFFRYCNIISNGLSIVSPRDHCFAAIHAIKSNIEGEGYFIDVNLSAAALTNFGSTMNAGGWVINMVKDSNGTPRNVVSNIVL
jgi:hypothetical protein